MDQLEAFSFSQPVASTSRVSAPSRRPSGSRAHYTFQAVFTLPFKGLSEEDEVQSGES